MSSKDALSAAYEDVRMDNTSTAWLFYTFVVFSKFLAIEFLSQKVIIF